MGDFDADWLALREPADMAARNQDILDGVVAAVGNRSHVRIMDLGAGTGSTLRAISERLPAWQTWILIDADADLLVVARDHLIDWAGADHPEEDVRVGGTPAPLQITKGTRVIKVRFVIRDLTTDGLPALDGGLHLVTASAFFDLTSRYFVETLVARIVKRKVALYSALEVDGRLSWTPEHPADGPMTAAFTHDQNRDKGFGAALGPAATSILKQAFVTSGYSVATGRSDWTLGAVGRSSKFASLSAAIARLWADVARENRMVAEQDVARWLAARQMDSSGCIVGHEDLLAIPEEGMPGSR